MERRPRQRRRKNRKVPAEEPTTIHDVPDDLLRQIFLRLDSPFWLVRASCVSKPFRRAVITGGRTFLRLAASLHPPIIVGHYHSLRDPLPGNAFVPSPSALPAPFVDVVDDDSGRFLPRRTLYRTRDRHVTDCHGGLVLILLFGSPPELIVYDPLTRRHQGIYRPADDQAAGAHKFAGAFLLDGDDGDISISNFRVLYRFDGGSHVCVFSTADGGGGGWRLLRRPADSGDRRDGCTGRPAGRIDGVLYVGLATGTVGALDNTSLEFSKVCLPIRVDCTPDSSYKSTFAVIHGGGAGNASPPTVRIVHVRGEALEVFRRVVDDGTNAGEWVLEHNIPRLLKAARKKLPGCPEKGGGRMVEMNVVAAGGTGLAVLSVLVAGYGRWFFSVDVDTMELKEVPQESYRAIEIFTYTLPWPRLLRACPC
ncbi:unnamed protein product [Urochloa humidicola]